MSVSRQLDHKKTCSCPGKRIAGHARIEDEDVGIVIEVKYASDGNMEKECENALQQITDVRYTESLEQEGIHKIIKYGIACYKKECKVMMKIEE